MDMVKSKTFRHLANGNKRKEDSTLRRPKKLGDALALLNSRGGCRWGLRKKNLSTPCLNDHARRAEGDKKKKELG